MRFGYWLPVFGGWLRNVDDEGMEASWRYVSRLARRSEETGFDLTLIAGRELARITDVRQTARGYANYQDWIANTKLEQRVSLEDYSVSNRGLKSGLTGTPERIAECIMAFEQAGVDLLLLQFSPQAEEMERFAEEVMPLVRASASQSATADAAEHQHYDEGDAQGRDEQPHGLLQCHAAAQPG